MAKATARPSRPTTNVVGSAMTPYRALIVRPVEHERERQAQLLVVAGDDFLVLTGVDPDDREPSRRELALEQLERDRLCATFDIPARPEVQNNDPAPVLSH